jgi:hypothetical protein
MTDELTADIKAQHSHVVDGLGQNRHCRWLLSA